MTIKLPLRTLLTCMCLVLLFGCEKSARVQFKKQQIIGSELVNGAESESASLDIGGERQIFIECQGEGFPTVVFVSGRSDRSTIWNTTAAIVKGNSSVISEVAKFTHACAYDRPGTITVTEQETVLPSRSSPVTQPTTPKDGVVDLHALLKAAKIPRPYVLVGHSFGGLIVRLYASSYPDEVAGMVLVDTLTEFLYDALTPAQQSLWTRLNSNYSPELDKYTVQEKTDFIASFNQLRSAPGFKVMPVVILTSDQTYDFKALMAQGILPKDTPLDFEATVFQAHLNGQKHLAKLLHAEHIMNTHAGHYVQTEHPQLVIDAIRRVVEQVRGT